MDIKASWLKVIIISPLEKGVDLLLKKLESPLPMQGCFLQNLVEISWPIVVLNKRIKLWKVYRQITGDQKSSLQL